MKSIRAIPMLVLPLLVACTGPASGYIGGPPEATTPETDDDDLVIDDDDLAEGPLLLINEFMADNEGSVLDDDGVASDWLELFNAGDEAVPLDGYGLSDDWTAPDLHVMTGGLVLGPGHHLLLWASGDAGAGVFHLGFRLSSQGEAFGLFDPDGEALDWVSYPPQTADHARGRAWDGADEWQEIPAGTPGESNG